MNPRRPPRLECLRCRAIIDDPRPFTGCPRCRAEGIAVNLTVALDLAWGFEGRTLDSELKLGKVTAEARTGIEYWYKNTFALRSGVNNKDLTFGAGVRYKQIGVDYAADLHRFFAGSDKAFPSDQNLDTTHLVSASYSW